MFEYYKHWTELWSVALMILGISIALSSPSAIISYITIFVSGMFAGRIIYDRKNKMQFPYFMIIVGFVIGYLIGIYYGSRMLVIALFVLGAILSYKLYDKNVLKDTRF